MADFINALKNEQNKVYTENGAKSYASTMSGVMDLFALGAAYRTRSDLDCIWLFDKAFAEDQTLALKCLFYLRDARGGQGERRFFRTVLHELAITHPDIVRRNLDNISEYGRYDDLYCLVNTPLENEMFAWIKKQLKLDMTSKTPSLLAKWLKSENASSNKTKILATKTRRALGLTSREYRKMLSKLREKINIVERLMSSNAWDQIEFDKIPSRAGFIYRNAFARRDIIKAKYEKFMTSKDTKVNAKTLYPYEVVHQILGNSYFSWPVEANFNTITRATLEKYWDNLADYIHGAKFNGLAIIDTSGSMSGTPIEVAVSLGMICAENCSGPYHNHFITFSGHPELQEIVGRDIVSKVCNLVHTDWGWNTNIEATFYLILKTAITNDIPQEDLPQSLIVISDMEFDQCGGEDCNETLFETIERKYAQHGYKMPNLVFWNVNARHDLIPMKQSGHVTYVSGFSPVLFDQIISGKTAWDLVLDKLLSERYAAIQ